MRKGGFRAANQPMRHDWAQTRHIAWIIVAKHGSKAASSSDFPCKATHEPPTDRSKASTHKTIIVAKLKHPTKSRSNFWSQAHASPLADADPIRE